MRRSRRGRAARASATACSTTQGFASTPTTSGPAASAMSSAPAPHTCTPTAQSTVARVADRRSLAASSSSAGVRSPAHTTRPGSSKNSTMSVCGRRSCTRSTSARAQAAAHSRGPAERTLRGQAEALQREAERERAGQLQLHRPQRLVAPRDHVEEREDAAVRVVVEPRVDGCGRRPRPGRQRTQLQRARAVDLHLGQRSQPCREHAFVRRARRELGRAREIGQRGEHELRRVDGVEMRQRTDRCSDASSQPCPTHGDS